jgi:hypothetical protein
MFSVPPAAADWLPPGKVAAVCMSVDDVHPTAPMAGEPVGNAARNALGHLEWLIHRHPRLRVTLFTTADWRSRSAAPTRQWRRRLPIVRHAFHASDVLGRGRHHASRVDGAAGAADRDGRSRHVVRQLRARSGHADRARRRGARQRPARRVAHHPAGPAVWPSGPHHNELPGDVFDRSRDGHPRVRRTARHQGPSPEAVRVLRRARRSRSPLRRIPRPGFSSSPRRRGAESWRGRRRPRHRRECRERRPRPLR